MDETVIGVIAAVHLADEGTQQRWFGGASTFPSVKEGDSGEWVEYLDAMLTSKGF